jgi:hypothetical protein
MIGEQAAKKQQANRAHYVKMTGRQESALLRLDIGDLARLDRARATAGLSRSAFVKLYLLPCADAVAASFPEIEAARCKSGLSLDTFMKRAVALALSVAAKDDSVASQAAANEFDALFGGDHEGSGA